MAPGGLILSSKELLVTVHRLAYLIAGLAVAAVVITGATFASLGYRVYLVHTGSMFPTYHSGDLVIDRPAHAADLKPGNVITFTHHAGTDTVSHRVAAVVSGGDLTTKGDANATPDSWYIAPAQVQGVVVGSVPHAGFVVYWLKRPAGIALILLVPALIWLLWGFCFPVLRRRWHIPGLSGPPLVSI